VIAVRGESKWKTLAQLVADAKSHPKGITVGNSGIGSHTHISSVALFKAAGVEAVDVPFGAAQVLRTCSEDRWMRAAASRGALGLREIGAGAPPRLLTSAEIPCSAMCHCARAGFRRFARSLARHRGAEGHAEGRRRRLEEAIRRTAASPDFAQASERLSVRPAFMAAEEFGNLIAKEDAELARIMQLIGLKK